MTLALTEYDQLPECIRALYSERDYQWLPDDHKGRLIQVETEPEVE